MGWRGDPDRKTKGGVGGGEEKKKNMLMNKQNIQTLANKKNLRIKNIKSKQKASVNESAIILRARV